MRSLEDILKSLPLFLDGSGNSMWPQQMPEEVWKEFLSPSKSQNIFQAQRFIRMEDAARIITNLYDRLADLESKKSAEEAPWDWEDNP